MVIVEFFRFSSINSVRVEAELRMIESRFPSEVVVVGVHCPKFPHEHDHAAVEQAVDRLGISHPVLDDPDLSTWQQYGIKGWPTAVLIDPEGLIVGGVSGEGCGAVLTSSIEQLIAQHEMRGTLSRDPIAGTWATTGATRGFHTLAFPGKVAVDPSGRRIAIADTGNDRVVVADLQGRVEQVFPLLTQPQGVAFDGDRIVVCDSGADRVVAIDRASGHQTVITDQLVSPWDVAVLADGALVVAEAGRHRLWKLAPGAEPEIVVTGDGQPSGVAALPGGGIAFVESDASALRMVSPSGDVTTLVGQGLWDWGASDGDRDTAALQHPLGVAAGPTGALHIADAFNGMIRVWEGSALRTLPAGGLSEPGGLALLADGRLVVADTNNHRVVLVGPDGADPVPIVLDESWLGTTPGDPMSTDSGASLTVPYELDLGAYSLDTSAGPAVRVEVSAEPASLLGPGPRSWALDAPSGAVNVTGAAPAEGLLVTSIEVNVCDDQHATVLRARTRHDLTVRACEP